MHHPGQFFRTGAYPVVSARNLRNLTSLRLEVQSLKVLRKRENGRIHCNSANSDDNDIIISFDSENLDSSEISKEYVTVFNENGNIFIPQYSIHDKIDNDKVSENAMLQENVSNTNICYELDELNDLDYDTFSPPHTIKKEPDF